jgi:hypothetical protein
VSNVTSALFKHACTVYEAMEASSETVEGRKVWKGHLTKVFTELGLPTPQYTHVMKCLKEMGCVEQIQRGGGIGNSQWQMIRPPEEELFLAKGSEARRRDSLRKQIDEQRLSDVHTRVSNLEDEVHKLKILMGVSDA